jgi:hypothetical protein
MRLSPCEAVEVASSSTAATAVAAVAGLGAAAAAVAAAFDKGSRPYQGNVGDEYDAWTEEGILEYYVSAAGTSLAG